MEVRRDRWWGWCDSKGRGPADRGDSDRAESAARTGEGGERVVTRKRRATRLYAAFERIDSMVVTRAGNRWPVESRMHGARVGRARGTSVHDTGT